MNRSPLAGFVPLGDIIGLVFNGYALREETKARKLGNLIALEQSHHAIWKQPSERELSRILDERADLQSNPLTNEETVFVTSLVIHFYSVYWAMKSRMFVRVEGVRKDVKAFFSLAIPRAVWNKVKPFQDEAFVRFVEAALVDK